MQEIEVGQDVVQPTRRRRHSKEFKAQVVRAAMQPNVSIAAVALHYRLNANMVRSWVATQEELDAAEEARKLMGAPPVEFVPLQLQLETPGVAPGPTEIQIEVRRGAATVTVRWPVSAASDCALWLQGWLR
ncbi:MAG: IS66-like element accessory protein TnpA [Pseudomonadales bacterium]